MYIIPAIDILGGTCVRLHQGNYSDVSEYDADPVAVARRFEQAGAKRIHIVDLDAARGDKDTNRKKVRKIRRAVRCTLELGGGIRSEDDIEELLDIGIDRLVLGTVFAKRPGLVEGWTAHYGNVFIAGIDARDGYVYVSGWEDETAFTDEELARRARELKMAGMIYTNISQDGTLEGPDIAGTNRMAEQAQIPVTLSGGIGSEADIASVAEQRRENVVGVIVGKAVYEGTIQLGRVIEQYQREVSTSTEW
jgi:phosphoribosylformimino-5-aminoimidazole carboxamide ribotide isomerase